MLNVLAVIAAAGISSGILMLPMIACAVVYKMTTGTDETIFEIIDRI